MVMEHNVEDTFPKIISVDDHVIEHRNVWLDRLPAKYHDVGPRTIQERGTMQFVGGNFSYVQLIQLFQISCLFSD